MIQNKLINKVIMLALALALLVSVTFVVFGNTQGKEGNIITEAEYATKLFGADIISIEIIADEDAWQEMLDNAINEQYIMADVVVNGEKFQNIGIRPKGNSSLMQVASSNSDRYSFRLQFDEYIKGQTCFGLESFVINNMLGDNTYMKEYVSYELMREAGVDAPYFSFADIKVNDKDWGLYLAVELYNESYEQRNFGDISGMLYNVKSMDMGQKQPGQEGGGSPKLSPGEQGGFNLPFDPGEQGGLNLPFGPGEQGEFNLPFGTSEEGDFSPQFGADESSATTPERSKTDNNRGTFGGMGGRGSSGGSLEYIDDNTESYSSIFDNVVGKGTEKDFRRVVQALKALSEGEDLETYFDIDQILRYLAAHTIVVNLDSYSSSMAQNYYVYERDGKITILPWDYNLAWGGFQNGNTSSVINFPIDTPLSGVNMSERPLIDKLFANTEYLERYHGYLQQLMDSYFADGKFEEKINTLETLISDYVSKDATAFCTYEEFETSLSTFITIGNLRAQSIQGQLEGNVPSTTAEQNSNPDKLISAGNIQLADLGSMMGHRAFGNDNMPSRGLSDKQIEDLTTIEAGQFDGRRQNIDGIKPPENNDGVGLLTGMLLFVIIAALIFAARFKKNY